MRTISVSFVALTLAACGGSADPAPTPGNLLDPPTRGIQLSMTTEIGPGAEVEHCKFVVSPPEPIYVQRDEVRYTAGSHHVLLFRTEYDSIPTEKLTGEPVDTSGVFDCTTGPNDGWAVTDIMAGSQNTAGDSIVSFPEGVAMRIEPNTVMMLNAHYINTTPDVLEPDVFINLHTIDERDVQTEGALFFWYDPFIRVKARDAAKAHMSCAIPNDVTVMTSSSHMHARGRGFEAMLHTPNGGSQPLFQTTNWEGVEVAEFEGGLAVPGNSRVDFYCDYSNSEDRDVYQGSKSTDEMCVFVGAYYPADPTTSYCSVPGMDPYATNFLGATFTGEGDMSCPDVLACLESAASSGKDPRVDEETMADIIDCVVGAKPEIAEEVSAGIRCLLTLEDGADPLTECEGEILACLTAE